MPEGQIDRRPAPSRFHRDPERSYTLPASYYFDTDVYAREKEAIFYRSWNFVGHVEQLRAAGSYVTCRVADQNIFVMRGKNGALRGFYNVCSHRAHELLKGCGTAKVIVCPYHAWSYHSDGRLRTARGSETMATFDAGEFCLKQVQVAEICGFVFANLDPQAAPLATQSGAFESEMRRYCPEIDRLVHSHRLTYELKANWKNVVDNFLECYHCSPAHPAFVDLVDIKNYRTVTHGIYSSHIAPAGRADNTAYHIPEGTPTDFAAWWLWPNVTFNTFPGPPNMTMLHIMPTGPETTLEHFDLYSLDKTPSDCEREAMKYIDEVLQPEDIGLVESVQRGLHSRGYHQGRFIVDNDRTYISEHGVHHFHRLVLEALGEMPT
ncbi:MAG TPA: ring-hydroxylating oxygenase subunit alpha [Candidatus Acidoferrum sp.]|nr:ring-hydroxylating oxygenase subunit alpha [Candidatus Acidoferrum sp.]